jgi:hypothetical protein
LSSEVLYPTGFLSGKPETGFHRAQDLNISGIGGQDDDSRFALRETLCESDHGIKAIHVGHLQVHKRNAWVVRAELVKSFAAIGSFRDQTHVRLSCQESGYSASE